MPRRRPGELLALEFRILHAGVRMQRDGSSFHGFALAAELAGDDETRGLTAHGTLYKALARLADAGLLEFDWEDADEAHAAGRPRRKLYRVTADGALAAARYDASRPATTTTSAARIAAGGTA